MSFELTFTERFGEYNLEDFDIYDVLIKPENIADLKAGSKASAGVFKKFIINPSKTLPNLYVKSGSTTGSYYSTLHPIQEYICSKIGRVLGINIVATTLMTVNSDIFTALETPANNDEREICNYCESEKKYCQCDLIFQNSSSDSKGTLGSVLGDNGRTLVSTTVSFIKKGYEFTSASSEFGEVNPSNLYSLIVNKYGDNDKVMKRIHRMMVFDYLVCNTDRHTSNFGFLTNIDTGEVELAPLYDHGLSFGLQLGNDHDIIEDGSKALRRCGGNPFGLLETGLVKANPKDLLGLKMEGDIDNILAFVGKFKSILPPTRYKIITNILTERWEHVQRVYTKAKG